MTATWITIGVLFVGTALSKAAGPLTVGGRTPGGVGMEVTRLVAPAILAGLVVYETLAGDGGGVRFDARLVGLVAAAAGIAARAPMIVVVLLAAAATAATRLVT
jgi:hypothetical protein